jgi:nitroreductase
MSVLEQSILERRSIRKFLSLPVPRALVDQALALAQHAPSNSNIQPWRLVFISGPARTRLRDALFGVADGEAPRIPALPKAFEHYRFELGAEVYGAMGIPRADIKVCRYIPTLSVMRNFDFFGAPLAGIVSMHRDLGPADAQRLRVAPPYEAAKPQFTDEELVNLTWPAIAINGWKRVAIAFRSSGRVSTRSS